jgi:energy-coupling factor transport system permease protein
VLTTTITIRFIPCLLKDLDTLQDSLRTRGYQMKDTNFIGRIKRRTTLILPLLSNSLERSIQSAEAMESRGFGSHGKKTFYKNIQTTSVDFFFILLSVVLFIFFSGMWFFKIGTYDYYPTITPISITLSYISLAVVLVFLVSAPVVFSPLKKVIDLD